MQTRINLIDASAVPIDRTATSAVPHRLLVFVANNSSALKNPAVIEAARSAAHNALAPSHSHAAAAFLAVPAGAAAVSSSAADELTPSAAAAGEATTPSSSSTAATVAAAVASLPVYKDATIRSIVEALLESDPLTFLEAILNVSGNAAAVAAKEEEEKAKATAAAAETTDAAAADGTTTTSNNAAPETTRNNTNTRPSNVVTSINNIIRYAYQVVLPAAIACEKHAVKLNAGSGHRRDGVSHAAEDSSAPASKVRRTEEGVVAADTTAEATAETDASGLPPGLADADNRPHHPCFLLCHAIADFTAAEALAASVSQTRRNRAIIDAISLLSISNGSSAPVSGKDLAAAKAILRKEGMLPPAVPHPHWRGHRRGEAAAKKTAGGAEDDEAQQQKNATEDNVAQEEGGADAEFLENEGDKKQDDVTAGDEAVTNDKQPDAQQAAAATTSYLPLADYLARLGCTVEKADALHKLFVAASTEARTVSRALYNSFQISHVFPDMNRDATFAPVQKIEFCSESSSGGSGRGGLYNLPRSATEADGIVTAMAPLLVGRFAVLAATDHGADGAASSATNQQQHRGAHHHHRRSTNATKPMALSELMNPQGFDFRFGDALMITPGTSK